MEPTSLYYPQVYKAEAGQSEHQSAPSPSRNNTRPAQLALVFIFSLLASSQSALVEVASQGVSIKDPLKPEPTCGPAFVTLNPKPKTQNPKP